MAADVTADMTVKMKVIGDSGGFAVLALASGSAADYLDMDTVLGVEVDVKFAVGMEDKAGTEAVTPCIWTGSTTTPDRITLGGSGSAVTYDLFVSWQSRSSTGGD